MEEHGDNLAVEDGPGCEPVVPDQIAIEVLPSFDDSFHRLFNITRSLPTFNHPQQLLDDPVPVVEPLPQRLYLQTPLRSLGPQFFVLLAVPLLYCQPLDGCLFVLILEDRQLSLESLFFELQLIDLKDGVGQL